MTIELIIHLERTGGDPPGVSWWAESDDAQGFYAVADSLEELRETALEALRAEYGQEVSVTERLDSEDLWGVRTVMTEPVLA